MGTVKLFYNIENMKNNVFMTLVLIERMWKRTCTKSLQTQVSAGRLIALHNLSVILTEIAAEISAVGRKGSSQTAGRTFKRGELKAGRPRTTHFCSRAVRISVYSLVKIISRSRMYCGRKLYGLKGAKVTGLNSVACLSGE